ncbi:hypothetical protein [Salinirubrum litoreum]|uniref:Uncharacterized protein n=1 Tax=Salinirubrum litoreum TaxID=1126234 RepID=A0ABD5REK8_9EURY|nr:hypothetical protein [Salinirubrum litoreum]
MARTVVVARVGATLGTALVREFADAGDRVALFARSPDLGESEAPSGRESGGTVRLSGTTLSADGSERLLDWSSAAHATKGFARSLPRRYGPDGVHVAEAFRRLVDQDDSAWTQELDLRPKERPA